MIAAIGWRGGGGGWREERALSSSLSGWLGGGAVAFSRWDRRGLELQMAWGSRRGAGVPFLPTSVRYQGDPAAPHICRITRPKPTWSKFAAWAAARKLEPPGI